MTRYLLDTVIVSDIAKPRPSPALQRWISAQPLDQLFIATMTLAEVWRGILALPAGARRDGLQHWFEGPSGPTALFADRMLPFDREAALIWARLIDEGRRVGRPRSPLDMIIAATALANGCVVATANERDFIGIEFVNPLHP